MTDTRRIQRTLFRMQADPSFAAAVFANEVRAIASTGLAGADLELLRELDPVAVAADAGDRRRGQILGNVASEYVLTIALAARGGADDLLEAFLASREFHAALAEDGRLPLAFAAYAAGRAPDGRTRGALALEGALVAARRAAPRAVSMEPGDVALAPRATLVELGAGTFDDATAVRAALDAGVPPPTRDLRTPDEAVELVLLTAPPDGNVHALPDLKAELLLPPADALLRAAADGPLSAATRAQFARAHGAEPADLEAFVDGLVADGALARA